MNIQQMQYYAEVCRQENVTKAAATLHMSQSTLSLAMKNIEEDTGLNLFRHVGRNIQLTEDGQALFHEVEKMLKQVKRFDASVKEIAKRHNRLQLAVPSQIATVILPLLLGEFRQLHPEIQLEITEPAGGAALGHWIWWNGKRLTWPLSMMRKAVLILACASYPPGPSVSAFPVSIR